MIPIKVRNSHKLAQEHAEIFYRYFASYKKGHILKLVEAWIATTFGANYNFKKILLAEPDDLEIIIQTFINSQNTNFPTCINNLKDFYAKFRTVQKSPFLEINGLPYNGYIFAKKLGLSVCPYCNRNFIFNIPQSNYTTCELDHFYNKSSYPFLSLSFYNLIPSCKTCNYVKSNKTGHYHNLHNSRLSESQLLKFSAKITGVSYLDNLEDLQIEFNCHPAFKDNFTDFKIEEIYGEHTDLVQDIIKKCYLYNTDYIDKLTTEFEGKLFKNRDELLNLLLSSFVQEANLSKRPFSKLTKDIWEQLSYLS